MLAWLDRDPRAEDNWALLHARARAEARGVPLAVAVALDAERDDTWRRMAFRIGGLRELEASLRARGIPLFARPGRPADLIPAWAAELNAGLVVTDFHALRGPRAQRAAVAEALDVPLIEVDAHNVLPARWLSGKQEYAARTIRPKIHRALEDWLVEIPALAPAPRDWPEDVPRVDWDALAEEADVDRDVPEAEDEPGAAAGRARLERFLGEELPGYDVAQRDPNAGSTSRLSAYLNFGQLSAQRAALALRAADGVPADQREAFLEQLLVRRELSDNYCLHNPDADRFAGFPDWARATLDAHRNDPRPERYERAAFEAAETESELWNAAQREMRVTGRMHNYLRMFWAKKILEWSGSPEEALDIGLALNDRYELDGKDPNGVVGVAWSVGGVHDRPWQERPIYGKVRYMNERGCRRKFDVDAYVRRWSGAPRLI